MKKIKYKGSYTVEASLLFPFILSVIILLMYISFFMHDKCVMNQSAYQAALRASRVKTGENEVMGTAERAAGELMNKTVLATSDVTHSIDISGSEVQVRYEGTLKIPAGVLFMDICGSDGIKVEGKGCAKRKDPVKFIRQCRVVEKMVKDKN
ncbi:MAG: pilus assembly protein [Lachnospiraceae bacterium]|nr:pilus assembly protein [Lachnospiraceae bacterium]